eukprot:1598437-Rhodomonas_salina.1
MQRDRELESARDRGGYRPVGLTRAGPWEDQSRLGARGPDGRGRGGQWGGVGGSKAHAAARTPPGQPSSPRSAASAPASPPARRRISASVSGLRLCRDSMTAALSGICRLPDCYTCSSELEKQ